MASNVRAARSPISFRPKSDTARKLEDLERILNASSSEVILRAIAELHSSLVMEQVPPYQAFKRSGLIGAFEGRPDSSTNYKQALTKAIKEKL